MSLRKDDHFWLSSRKCCGMRGCDGGFLKEIRENARSRLANLALNKQQHKTWKHVERDWTYSSIHSDSYIVRLLQPKLWQLVLWKYWAGSVRSGKMSRSISWKEDAVKGHECCLRTRLALEKRRDMCLGLQCNEFWRRRDAVRFKDEEVVEVEADFSTTLMNVFKATCYGGAILVVAPCSDFVDMTYWNQWTVAPRCVSGRPNAA